MKTEEPDHVLVVTGETEEERDFEIEHPDCPVACDWYPHSADYIAELRGRPAEDFERHFLDENDRDPGYLRCYVNYEVENIGLDSLGGEIDGVYYEGGVRYVDGKWVSDQWRKIPPGRYVIRGWYTPPGWAGADPVDADGGLDLIGRAP